MKKKTKIITATVGALVLGLGIMTSDALAEGKQKLAHLVLEHEQKIAALEEAFQSLSPSSGNAEIPQETLEALSREVEITLFQFDDYWDEEIGDMAKININEYKVIDSNGEAIVQVFIEGNYGWKQDDSGTFEPGRVLAYNFINHFHPFAEIYGVEVNYEFYQNGERVGAELLKP
ncbi:hypothetical protein JOC95_000388 [Bacillus tianshenii]|uniref:Uncharacterized protein n=1 Tax=Sutcliffiella tianshenii TaxID=1463404 RepID=A0ABS2NV75_9BACI|nr:hypothetical protein [Bacillus tianshenii]MBM7618546.1 hypothetical protein [Bacillus tianshenii]